MSSHEQRIEFLEDCGQRIQEIRRRLISVAGIPGVDNASKRLLQALVELDNAKNAEELNHEVRCRMLNRENAALTYEGDHDRNQH